MGWNIHQEFCTPFECVPGCERSVERDNDADNRTQVIFDIIDFCEMDRNWEVKVEYVTEQLKRLGL